MKDILQERIYDCTGAPQVDVPLMIYVLVSYITMLVCGAVF